MSEYVHAILYIYFSEKLTALIGAENMNKKNISNKTEYVMHGEIPKDESLGFWL